MPISLTAAADDDGRRLDRILRKALPDMPLSAIHRLLRKGGVLVDGEKAAIDYRVKTGQTITLSSLVPSPQSLVPIIQSPVPSPQSLFPDIILFEGAGLLVLNKPAGLPVHGRESLEGIVRSYLVPKLSPSLSFKPGPLHRLDRPSSGVIAFSTSLEGARFFSAMMRNRMIKKQYLALVNGVIEKDEVWEDELVRDERQKKTFRLGIVPGVLRPGEAKTALTRVSPLAGDGGHTLILAEIETGRTHQIRVQAASRGHPLLGDRKYGGTIYGDVNGDNIRGGFLLHAWRMEFTVKTDEKTDNDIYGGIPRGLPGGLPPYIEAPLPENFLDKIRNFFGGGIINKRLSHL